MSCNTLRALLIGFVCLVCTGLWAQEFSADIVNNQNNKERQKIFVGKNKVRLEANGAGGSGAVIWNLDTETTDMVMPERHMYMEMQASNPMMRRHYNFFRPQDVDDACTSWRHLTERPGGTCSKIGDDTVDGRKAVKYEGTSQDGNKTWVWVDRKLRFPIKWEGDKGDRGGRLQNIQEGAQPASLFEIPADYQKMDMGNMMRGQHPPN